MLQELLMAAAVMTGASAAFGRTFAGTAAYPQTFVDEFNPLKYTGNLGPYTQRPGVGISPDVPEGCEVEQVVLFARHGERYPTSAEVVAQKKVLESILSGAPESGFVGSLSFLNHYEYFLKDDGDAELEIASGPYSGLADAYSFGAEFAGQYGDLWNEEILPIFSDAFERDLETARAFGQGFLGLNYSKSAAINTYPSFDTCPGAKEWTTCPVKPGNSSGYPLNTFRYPAFETAALRLNEENALNLTADDIFILFTIASYEISAKGSSPWVDVFTPDEWIAFQYSYDVYFDCYFGSQSPRAKAIGSLFVEAAANVLKEGPEKALPLSLVFGHDIDLTSILAALDLATPTRKLDPNAISFNNNFRISDVAPMGARFVIERIVCKAPGLTSDTNLIGLTNSTKPLWNPNWTEPETNFTVWYPNITLSNGTGGAGNWSNSTGSNGTISAPNATFPNATYPNATFPNATFPNATFPNATYPNATFPNSTTRANSTNSTSSGSSSNGTSSTGGATWTESPATAVNTTFIRFVLNDAVVPWEHCYDGPGFSCSLENFLEIVDTQVKEANAKEVCGTTTPITFLTKHNDSTSLNYNTEPVPYQATTVPVA